MDTDRTTGWAWALVGGWVILGWIPVDIWLKRHHHLYLTSQMRIWMRSPRFGWAIWATLAAIPVAFITHMLIKDTQE